MLKKETIEEIRKDFPKESVQVKKAWRDESTGEQVRLTGYKPQYVIERLNDVFGHDGWDFTVSKYDIETKDVYVLGRLTVYEVKRDDNSIDGPLLRKTLTVKEQFGTGSYNKATTLGDALKGASTNALEKCSSMLDVGHMAYKGLLEIPDIHPERKESETEKIKKNLASVCKKHNIGKKEFPTLIKTVFKEEKETKNLTLEEMTELYEYVKKNGAPF